MARLVITCRRAVAASTVALVVAAGCASDDVAKPEPGTTPVPTAAAAAPAPSTPPLTAAPTDRRWQDFVDHALAASPGVPGIALTVLAPDDGVDESVAAGNGDGTGGMPGTLTPDRPFRIASNTKTFTAAATLRLVEQSAIGLDDPLAERASPDLVELLRQDGYAVDAITIRQLLQHTSGLHDYAEDPNYEAEVIADPSRRWTRADQVGEATRLGDPLGPPGQQFAYSDTDYILLGDVIERSTGKTLGAAYRDLLDLDRLGLRSTWQESIDPVPAGTPARAHQLIADLDSYDADPSFDLYGGGGLVSTTADLAHFYRALLGGAIFRDPATLRAMLEVPATNETSGAASGLFRSDAQEQGPCWSHSGFWGTYVITCPAVDVTVAVSVFQASPTPPFDIAALAADAITLARSK
jgi:D-alanyl-D-alanine carboxypeptidase